MRNAFFQIHGQYGTRLQITSPAQASILQVDLRVPLFSPINILFINFTWVMCKGFYLSAFVYIFQLC
jgi:hypothetical protein